MEKKVKYIGLDISTSIIGICLLDENGSLINLENINLKKIKGIFQKARYTEDYLVDLKNRYSISDNIIVSIEEALQSFKNSFSSAKTITQLSRFNGIVSYMSYSIFNSEPVFINVNSARKNLQIKINKKSNLNTKQQVFEWVQHNINFEWPTKILKSGPNKGLVKFEDSCYDMSDAYVICKAYIYNEKNNS